MPPTPEVPHGELRAKLQDENIFDKHGNALPQGDPIWASLCKKYRWKMRPQTLHLHVYKDCKEECRSQLLEYQGIRVRKIKKKKVSKDEEYHVYPISNPHNKKPLKFTIFFNEEEWLKMKPVVSKRKQKLQPGWTDMVYDKIWFAERLKCAYNFKTLSITSAIDDMQIMFDAFCTECGTGMNGMLVRSNTGPENSIEFEINTFAVQDIDHNSKRHFAHRERKEAKKVLANKYATDYRADIQKERMNGQSEEPANLHDSGIYQGARQEARDEEIGYDRSLTLFTPSLVQKCGIRKVSLDPFYVVYCLDEQLEFWGKACQLNLPTSLDATGGLIRRKITSSLKCKRIILYYALVVGVDKKIVPVMQFITSIHHVGIIEEALNTWIEKCKAQTPDNISTDGSTALQHGVCKSFNNISFNEYNLRCYQFLRNERTKLPSCCYKSDLAHLFGTLNYWSCFSAKKDKTKLQFYKRCISFISKVTSIQDFKQAAVALFAVSMCTQYVENSLCHGYLIMLSDAIRTHILPEDEQVSPADEIMSKKIINEEPLKIVNSLTVFVDEIITEAKAAAESALIPIAAKSIEAGDENSEKKIEDVSTIYRTQNHSVTKVSAPKPNVYACKGFDKHFKSMCQKFCSWTNVLAAAYGYKGDELNSARSETHFKIKKSQIPKPISIIRFLLRDAKKIESAATRDYPSLRKLSSLSNQVKLSGKSPFHFEDPAETETDKIIQVY